MLKIFGGMIIGSMMTMMLLGGPSAADQVLTNLQNIYLDRLNRPDSATTLILLVTLSIFLSALAIWPQKPVIESKQFIRKLKRHCR